MGDARKRRLAALRQTFRRPWAFIKKVNADDCQGLACELAFNVVQSLIPAAFFLVATFGLLGGQDVFYQLVIDLINRLAPVHTTELLVGLVDATVRGSSTGLTIIGMLITVWAASGGGGVVVKGLQRIYGIPDEPFPFWYSPLISVVLTLSLGVVLMLAVYLIMFGDNLIAWLHRRFSLEFNTVALLNVLRWLIVGSGITGGTAFSYALLLRPRTKRLHWRKALPGAVFFLLAWVSVSGLFSIYVDKMNQFNPVYGTLGALIILVTWLYYSALIFFIGAEITAMRAAPQDRHPHHKAPRLSKSQKL